MTAFAACPSAHATNQLLLLHQRNLWSCTATVSDVAALT